MDPSSGRRREHYCAFVQNEVVQILQSLHRPEVECDQATRDRAGSLIQELLRHNGACFCLHCFAFLVHYAERQGHNVLPEAREQ